METKIEFATDAWDAFIRTINGMEGLMVRVVGAPGKGTRTGIIANAYDRQLLIYEENTKDPVLPGDPVVIEWKDIQKVKVL